VLFLLLLIALATSFNVYTNKEGTKCYVEAKQNSDKGKTIYLDMSDYLAKDKYLMFILDEASGFYPTTVGQNLTSSCVKMAPGLPGEDMAFYLNGKNMALFLNPCVEFSVVRSFTIDNVEHVNPVNRTCFSVDTNEKTASNGCIGIFGEIALGNENTVLYKIQLEGTLRAIKAEVLRGASIIYKEETPTEPGATYSRYTLSISAHTKVEDMVPVYPLNNPSIQPIFDNCYKYKIDVNFDGFARYDPGSKISVVNAEDATDENAHGTINIKFQMEGAPYEGFEYQTGKPIIDAGYKSTFVASILALLVSFVLLI